MVGSGHAQFERDGGPQLQATNTKGISFGMFYGMNKRKCAQKAHEYLPTGGKRGIRTLGTGEPVRRISNPVHSTTLPSFRVSRRRFYQRPIDAFPLMGAWLRALQGLPLQLA